MKIQSRTDILNSKNIEMPNSMRFKAKKIFLGNLGRKNKKSRKWRLEGQFWNDISFFNG
jgi:hypothetical protein